jgi:hypothetical protein
LILSSHTKEHNDDTKDGIRAYKHLQVMFAPSDITAKLSAHRDYNNITLHNNKTVANFNTRFNQIKQIALTSGVIFSSPHIIDHYLLNLSCINIPALQVTIRMLQNDRAREHLLGSTTTMLLSTIQSDLLREQVELFIAAQGKSHFIPNRNAQANNVNRANPNTPRSTNARN